jgi:GrpB-like predicted nucleotidyltransferase (UPF0157 family)
MLGLERDLVRLVPYRPGWARCFQEEALRLRAALGDCALAIEHIGSTAIEGVEAKPILDLQVGVRSVADAAFFQQALAPLGYEGGEDPEIPGRLYFVKRTAQGKSTHHLNVLEMESELWTSHLRFRDYLRAHPEARARYRRLKADLAHRFAHRRRAYTDAKATFIKAILEAAAGE